MVFRMKGGYWFMTFLKIVLFASRPFFLTQSNIWLSIISEKGLWMLFYLQRGLCCYLLFSRLEISKWNFNGTPIDFHNPINVKVNYKVAIILRKPANSIPRSFTALLKVFDFQLNLLKNFLSRYFISLYL